MMTRALAPRAASGGELGDPEDVRKRSTGRTVAVARVEIR